MGMTYVCERCGTSLHGVNSHVCQISLVESFNIHQDCLDEKTLREQIAREIPELIVELKAYWNEQSMFDGFDYISDENFERILNFVAAAIARGDKE